MTDHVLQLLGALLLCIPCTSALFREGAAAEWASESSVYAYFSTERDFGSYRFSIALSVTSSLPRPSPFGKVLWVLPTILPVAPSPGPPGCPPLDTDLSKASQLQGCDGQCNVAVSESRSKHVYLNITAIPNSTPWQHIIVIARTSNKQPDPCTGEEMISMPLSPQYRIMGWGTDTGYSEDVYIPADLPLGDLDTDRATPVSLHAHPSAQNAFVLASMNGSSRIYMLGKDLEGFADTSKFTALPDPPEQVREVYPGDKTVFALTVSGQLLCMGSNTRGLCNFDPTPNAFSTWKTVWPTRHVWYGHSPVDVGEMKVKYVGIGDDFAAAVVVNGTGAYVLTWGKYTRTGTGNDATLKYPQVLDPAAMHKPFYALTCGDEFCAVCARDGLYYWGDGLLSSRNLETPQLQPYQINCQKMRAGGGYLYASNGSDIVNMGKDGSGQLGRACSTTFCEPEKYMFSLHDMLHVATGDKHVVVYTHEGLFVHGEGSDHRLGLGSSSNQKVPKQLHLPSNMVVRDVAAGKKTSYALLKPCSRYDCSYHAPAPSISQDGCRCQCDGNWITNKTEPWNGRQCNYCPPPFGGTYCNETVCRNDTDCSLHAISVTGTTGQCNCTCMNQWTGSRCDTCPSLYSGASCDTCASGRHSYPKCEACNVTHSCFGNAVDVRANSNGCLCTCRPGFNATVSCKVCEDRYAGPLCDSCAVGLAGYPECSPCTSLANCSGNGQASVVNGTCTCSCSGSWENKDCSFCPSRFAGAGCDSCAVGYFNYPTCTKCDVATHCSNHATAVTSNGTVCECQCMPGYVGASCEMCFKGNSSSAGYIEVLNACEKCNSVAHCNSRAASDVITAVGNECQCQCLGRWEGPRCDTCPSQYDSTSCMECAAGHINFPQCTRCDVLTHCHGNAVSVDTDASQTSCVCTCRNYWSPSSQCQTCDTKYSGSDCDQCANNGLPPACDACSNATDCSGHAASVTQQGATCSCTCLPLWEGVNCERCKPVYSGANCEKCAANRVQYPKCDLCTCENNGRVNTTGDTCSCNCVPPWTGKTCSVCPPKYNTACNSCAPGRVKFPDCELCTSQMHCSGHGTVAVKGDTCECTCTGVWSGSQCSVCPSQYEGTQCDQCADQRILYPQCTECSVTAHCNGRAISTSPNATNDGCECHCEKPYTGTTCDECAEGYIVEMQGGSQSCVKCTVTSHCSANALQVSDDGTRKSCVCQCVGNWTGTDCSSCPVQYDQTTCTSCATGRVGYPECIECSVATHCSGHASAVVQDNLVCKCSCENQWTGSSCDVCPPQYGGAECDACAQDAAGSYPWCETCDVNKHCAPTYTTGVHSNGTACICDCLDQWSGERCHRCEAHFNDTCNGCAWNHVNYPLCTPCDGATACSSHGVAVSEGGQSTSCECKCLDMWEGDDCSVCPSKYEQQGCAACAPGRYDFPVCDECTIDQHCSGKASGVTPLGNGTCVCDCLALYAGERCSTLCDLDQDCTGNGANITATGQGCVCECRPGWIGDDCAERCTIEQSCSGHATQVVSNQTHCICSCEPPWTGMRCNVLGACTTTHNCSGHATSVSEGPSGCVCSCSEGWIGPQCATACSNTTHCNARARGITSNGTHCLCDCTPPWGGAVCDEVIGCSVAHNCSGNALKVTEEGGRCMCECRAPWGGKTCSEQCSVQTHCSGHATSVIGTPEGCNCTCQKGWIGERCDEECDVQRHCSGQATSVRAERGVSCVCTCRVPWEGAQCNHCPDRYNGSKCERCAMSEFGMRVDYPKCTLPSVLSVTTSPERLTSEVIRDEGAQIILTIVNDRFRQQGPAEAVMLAAVTVAGGHDNPSGTSQRVNASSTFVRTEVSADGSRLVISIGPDPTYRAKWEETVTIGFAAGLLESGDPVSPQTVTIAAEKPVKLREEQETVKSLSVLSAATGGGAGLAKLSLFVKSECSNQTNSDEEPLDWTMDPVHYPIGTGRHKYHLGAMVFNCVVLLSILTFHFFLVLCYRAYAALPLVDAMGALRFPGFILIPTMFVYQGICVASAHPVFFPSDAGLAVLSTIVFLGFPTAILLLVVLRVHGKYFKAHYEVDESRLGGGMVNAVKRFFMGTGVWYSTEGKFAEMWGVVFEHMRDGYQWFAVVELGQIMLLSLVSLIKVSEPDACMGHNFAMAALVLIYFIVCCVLRPFQSLYDNGFAIIESGIQTIAVVLTGVGFHQDDPDHWTFAWAGVLILIGTVLLFIKSVCDAIIVIYELRLGQTHLRNIRALEREKEDCLLTKGSELEEMHSINPHPVTLLWLLELFGHADLISVLERTGVLSVNDLAKMPAGEVSRLLFASPDDPRGFALHAAAEKIVAVVDLLQACDVAQFNISNVFATHGVLSVAQVAASGDDFLIRCGLTPQQAAAVVNKAQGNNSRSPALLAPKLSFSASSEEVTTSPLSGTLSTSNAQLVLTISPLQSSTRRPRGPSKVLSPTIIHRI